MQLQDLQYLNALTETLSFRQTAKRFKVSQSTISRGIARLEDQLGLNLFSREGSKVYLSSFGQAMKPMLEDLMTGLENAEIHANSLLRGEAGVIRVGIDETAPFSLVQDFFQIFASKISSSELEFIHARGIELEKMLLHAELDTAIVDPIYGISDLCRSTMLYREPFVLATSPHAIPSSDLPLADTINAHSMPLVVNSATTTDDCIKTICANLGITPASIYRCARIDWLTGLVRAGAGLGYMPQALAQDAGFTVLRTYEKIHPPHDLKFITARGRAFSPSLRVLDLEATLFGRAMSVSGRWASAGPFGENGCSRKSA